MSITQNFHLLELDTSLFGFKVAKITAPRQTQKELKDTLQLLKELNVRLVYWPSDSTDQESQVAAKECSGFLGSEQITYLLKLNTLKGLPAIAPEIKPYQSKVPSAELEQLAVYASTYSHFNTDPKFPRELLLKLYQAWIVNSVNGSFALKVLVSQNSNTLTGMITLGTKNGRGDIGLLSVDPIFRGQNLGTKLVCAAQNYFSKSNFSHLQVVTQKANIGACRLYEKCGFTPEKVDNFYHFWL